MFAAGVLVSMMVFFIVLHPISIMDEDDVIYSVLIRKAIPIPGGWNPSRLMPEVLASFCGHTAAILTRLGLGHFIHCQVAFAGFFAGSSAWIRSCHAASPCSFWNCIFWCM